MSVNRYEIDTANYPVSQTSIVIATGWLASHKIGVTGFGYDIAVQFDVVLVPQHAGAVPWTFTDEINNVVRLF